MEGCDQVGSVSRSCNTGVGGRLCWIAAWNRGRRSVQRWNRAGCGVKLRQAVELLVRNAVVRPVLAHVSEVVIERPILLRENKDVIDTLQASYVWREVGSHASGCAQGYVAASGACARAAPVGKSVTGRGGLGKRYRGVSRESCGAGWS